MIEFEKFLAPWEHDGDGKALDEPKEIEADTLKKYIYNLLKDKEETQEARDAAIAEQDKATQALEELQRKNETDEQRRTREQQQRETEFAALQKKNAERDKVDAILAKFEGQGITATQARKLAKRVSGEKESDWLADAAELVEDGFKIGTGKPAGETGGGDGGDDGDDDLTSSPRATRNGKPVQPTTKDKAKSIKEELDKGIPLSGW